jgi:predicted dienelactone hydrolase
VHPPYHPTVLTPFAKGNWRSIAFVAAAAVVTASSVARADSAFEVPPLALPGPFPVACSNVVQDFTRVGTGESASDYWEAVPRSSGGSRYVTDLLADPPNTLSVAVTAPSDGSLFSSFAGRTIPYVVVVCYPTTPSNPRPDYLLPTGKALPHMQRGSEAPLFADAAARYPLLLFSHGYGGSPLSDDYIDPIMVFASFGYVVAAPFHGDPRVADLVPESLNNLFYLLTHLDNFIAMQALRPLALSATLDLLLSNAQWSQHVDAAKVGGFGASQGGETLLLMAGAALTKTIGLSSSRVINDPRLKAAVGYIPYFGQPLMPAFGRDQNGLDGVTLPFLAISGTADTTAPIALTAQGISRLAGPRELVALNGVDHHFDIASTNDIYTWSLTFLDAKVREDPAALERLRRMTSVAGGGDDSVVIPYAEPASNFTGLWWNAPAGSEAGWGISFAHQGDVIFAAWFSYDLDGKARWLVMTAPNTGGSTFAGTLFEVTGPSFDAVPFDPAQVTRTPVGTGTLAFTDADNGTFAYTVNGVSQTKAITREVFGPLPSCIFGGQPDPALATNYQDLWWNAPPGSESGWGINLAHEGDTIFATWFTYDHDRTPLWLVATATRTMPGTYGGTFYRTTGPPFNAVPFNPAAVVRTAAGNVTLTFTNGNSATFAYAIDGVSQMKTITREIFRAPGTVCR